MKYLSFLLLFISVLIACKHPIPVNPNGNGNNNGNNNNNSRPCSPDTVYFGNDILPLLISNCAMAGCHNATSHQDGVILDSYANVMATAGIEVGKPTKSDLYKAITETDLDKLMPPPPKTKLTSTQIQLISKWITQGALNLSCQADCDTTKFTYNLTIKPLLQSNCVGCHSGSAPSGGINLSTYTGTKTVALNGKLYGSIARNSGFSAMPKNGNKLPDCAITQVKKWIKAGALQN